MDLFGCREWITRRAPLKEGALNFWQDEYSRLLAPRSPAVLRVRAIRARVREIAQAVQALSETVGEADIGQAAEMLRALHRFRPSLSQELHEPPLVESEGESQVSIAVHQFSHQVNGGPGRCRLCDGKLLNPDSSCGSCGAAADRALSPVAAGRGWTRKMTPADLAVVIVLAGHYPTAAHWRGFAKEGKTADVIISGIARLVTKALVAFRAEQRRTLASVHSLTFSGATSSQAPR